MKTTKSKKRRAKKNKKPSFFARAGSAISRFFREYRSEVKKVIWPSFSTVVKNSVVVLVIVVIMGIFIGALDIGLSALLGLITV